MRKIETLEKMLDCAGWYDSELARHGTVPPFLKETSLRQHHYELPAAMWDVRKACRKSLLPARRQPIILNCITCAPCGAMLQKADRKTAQQFCQYDLKQYTSICKKLTQV